MWVFPKRIQFWRPHVCFLEPLFIPWLLTLLVGSLWSSQWSGKDSTRDQHFFVNCSKGLLWLYYWRAFLHVNEIAQIRIHYSIIVYSPRILKWRFYTLTLVVTLLLEWISQGPQSFTLIKYLQCILHDHAYINHWGLKKDNNFKRT